MAQLTRRIKTIGYMDGRVGGMKGWSQHQMESPNNYARALHLILNPAFYFRLSRAAFT